MQREKSFTVKAGMHKSLMSIQRKRRSLQEEAPQCRDHQGQSKGQLSLAYGEDHAGHMSAVPAVGGLALRNNKPKEEEHKEKGEKKVGEGMEGGTWAVFSEISG